MVNHPNRSKQQQAQHTPGPWHIAAGDARFVSMPGIVKPLNCGNQGNARLIAAAPELLAALKLIANGIRSGHIEDQTILDHSNPHAASIPMTPLSEIIDAAVAKAEGR